MRNQVKTIIEHNAFISIITALICLNAVTLGLETDPYIMSHYGDILTLIDGIIIAVFTLEIAAKLSVYKGSFFKSGWNVFDFVIVGISLIPASGPLSVLRAFRILRVLRLFSVVPQMRRVIDALFYALPGMSSVIGVLMIVFYVAAVLATNLFGVSENPELQLWFGSIGASMYTLFQIMTLESWSMGIVRPTLQLYPWAWAFFVPFIIVTSFAVLNLFIGIIVDSMSRVAADDNPALDSESHEKLEVRIKEMQGQIAYLTELVERQNRVKFTSDNPHKPAAHTKNDNAA